MTASRETQLRNAAQEALRSDWVLQRMAETRDVLVAALIQAGFAVTSPAPRERVHSSSDGDVLLAEATVLDSHLGNPLTVQVGLELMLEPSNFGHAFAFWEVRRQDLGGVLRFHDDLTLARAGLFTAASIPEVRRTAKLTEVLVSHIREHADMADESWLNGSALKTAQDLIQTLAP